MGIRTGTEYIESLKDGRKLFIDGKLVQDVTTYAPLKRIIQTIADVFDAQHNEAYHDILTYVSPETGERVSKTYFPAQTVEEFRERRRCEYLRTDLTYGMMGRLTDFMSAFFLDQAASFRAQGFHEAAERTEWYIEHCRKYDLQVTHALIDPQSDRSREDAPNEAVRIVERRSDGIVVRGARLLSTLAPVANECYVGPYFPRIPGEDDFAAIFTMPMNATGLKILARESFDKGRSLFDRPLSGRFDEGDAVLVFDDVFIPSERVMVPGDVRGWNAALAATVGYVGIQAVTRSAAKLRFLSGLAALVAQANGRAKMPATQEKLGELVAYVAIADALGDAACVDAARRAEAHQRGEVGLAGRGPGEPRYSDQASFAALNVLFPSVNDTATDLLRMVAGSGPLAMTEADCDNPEIKPLIDRLLIGPAIDARHRLQLMKMVWDMTSTEFGSRQTLYERLYSGDPAKNRQRWFTSPKRIECEDMAKRLLGWQ
nr:4-hydroxyphenylacetate 3-monooxygenase oxygenase component [Paraburkholderia sp.]